MATTPLQVDETDLVRETIEQIAFPKGMRLKSIQESPDSTGQLAWHIYLAVSKRIPLTKRRIAEIRRASSAVQDALLDLPTSKWPFVHLLEMK